MRNALPRSARTARVAGIRSRRHQRAGVRMVGALPSNPFGYALVATLGVGVGATVLGAVSSLATVLTYVGLALFLAAALDPVLTWMASHGVRRGVSALILTAAGALALVGVSIAVIPSATEQVTIAAERLIDLAQSIPDQPWFEWVSSNLPASIDVSTMLSNAVAVLADPDQLLAIGGGLLQVGSGIVGGVTGVIVVAILTLYFLVSLPRVKAKAFQFVAASHRNAVTELAEEILDSVGRYVGGQLLLAAINATFTFILTSLVGSPAPVLLAVLAFVGALIPVVGTVFGALAAVLLTLTVNPIGALIVGIVMLVYMQVEAYVLSPRVMARAVAVPAALVIIAALAGAALAGILGALVAVPVAAAALLIVERVVLPAQARR